MEVIVGGGYQDLLNGICQLWQPPVQLIAAAVTTCLSKISLMNLQLRYALA
jgi:hypothetical protein